MIVTRSELQGAASPHNDMGCDDRDGLHIYFSYLDGFEKDNLVVHLVHLLLVSLHKAVAKLDSHLGRLLYN